MKGRVGGERERMREKGSETVQGKVQVSELYQQVQDWLPGRLGTTDVSSVTTKREAQTRMQSQSLGLRRRNTGADNARVSQHSAHAFTDR